MTAKPGIALVERVEQIIADGMVKGLKIFAIILVPKHLRLWRRETQSLLYAAIDANGPTYRGIPVRRALQETSAVLAKDSKGRLGVCTIIGNPDVQPDITVTGPIVWCAMSSPTRH